MLRGGGKKKTKKPSCDGKTSACVTNPGTVW